MYLRQFLWERKNGEKKAAMVSWETICLDDSRGGLGVPALQVLNSGLIMKILWSIRARKESPWVRWVHNVILKGKSI